MSCGAAARCIPARTGAAGGLESAGRPPDRVGEYVTVNLKLHWNCLLQLFRVIECPSRLCTLSRAAAGYRRRRTFAGAPGTHLVLFSSIGNRQNQVRWTLGIVSSFQVNGQINVHRNCARAGDGNEPIVPREWRVVFSPPLSPTLHLRPQCFPQAVRTAPADSDGLATGRPANWFTEPRAVVAATIIPSGPCCLIRLR